MDLKRFSVFIIIAGLLVSFFGVFKFLAVSNQLSSTTKSINRKYSPFDSFDRASARAQAKDKQQGPIIIIGVGVIIILIGIGVNYSANKNYQGQGSFEGLGMTCPLTLYQP